MKLMKHNQAKTEALAPISWSWQPFWPVSRLQSQIEQLFEESFDRWLEPVHAPLGSWMPAVDVFEDKEKVVVKTELPGMKRDEIEVYMAGDSLHIAGERQAETEHKSGEVRMVERHFGRFHRSIPLPVAVEAGKIAAHYKDGVLTVSCPKAQGTKQKEIEIKIG